MSENTSKLSKIAPWLLLPVVAAGAFTIGTCLATPRAGTEGQPDHQGHAHGTDEEAGPRVWTCSMHAQVQAEEPGSCPICGMDLIPMDASSGPDRVTLDDRARALSRIRTARVEYAGATGERRLLGEVTPDESTRRDVTAWIGGRIERLHVDVTGAQIRRGQVIATLYSPEVYAAHQDLLVAKAQVARLSGGTTTARRAAGATLTASRQRLRLLGIPEGDLQRMENATTPGRTVRIRSPFSGTVLERSATEGSYVQTGAVLYRLADLDRLWVQLDAYESDLPLLAEGQRVRFSVEGLPGEHLEGHVRFVDPVVDPSRRTARVRVEVDSRDGRLLPGMFVEAQVEVDRGGTETPLVIPASAPLFTGRRSVVYVEVVGMDPPTYAPRSVRLGPRSGDVYPVVSGLAEGERVVVEGAFAIDADLQIRGGNAMMARADDRTRGDALADSLPAPFQQSLSEAVDTYLDLATALAADDLSVTNREGAELRDLAEAFEPNGPPDAAEAWAPLRLSLIDAGTHIADAPSLDLARRAFERASIAAIAVIDAFGNPTGTPLRRAHCPMAFDFAGADWVQRGEVIDNAYFGDEMRTCGTIRETYEPLGAPPRPEAAAEAPPSPAPTANDQGAGEERGPRPSPGPRGMAAAMRRRPVENGASAAGETTGAAARVAMAPTAEARTPPTTRTTPTTPTPAATMTGATLAAPTAAPATMSTTANMSPAGSYYTCPMHPRIHEAGPGRCPHCRMRLVQRQAGGGR